MYVFVNLSIYRLTCIVFLNKYIKNNIIDPFLITIFAILIIQINKKKLNIS